MTEGSLRVLAVIGSLKKANSVTRAVVNYAARQLADRGCTVDTLDLLSEPLPLYNPELAYQAEHFPALKARVDRADVYVLGTPDYHGSISSAMKNFLDHFWHEFAGQTLRHDRRLTRERADRHRSTSNRGTAMLRLVAALRGLVH